MNWFKMSVTVSVAALLSGCMAKSPPPDYNPPPKVYEEPAVYEAPREPVSMSMHDQVHNALMDSMGTAASDIEVRVDGGTVYLTGHVGSKADHDRAHDIAHNVSGVSSVDHSGLVVH